MRSKFMELLEESVIVQSVATLLLLGAVITMYMVPLFRGADMATVEIPELLAALTGTVMGFWFKSKGELAARKLH